MSYCLNHPATATVYQAPAGYKGLSWALTANLWGQVIDTIRYERQSLGHSSHSVWTVNPAWTSQTCHVCRQKGLRVHGRNSEVEEKGGEYFYCPACGLHIHADINAARNIIDVHNLSAVPERTKDKNPSLFNLK